MLPVLHVVTTDEVLRLPDFTSRAHAVLAAGGTRLALHIRGGRTAARKIYDAVTTLVPVANTTGSWIVVNDRVDVALAAGAHGAQLTSRSLTVSDARAVAPALRIGASVHSAAEARAAAEAGASWLVAGNVYRTATHPERDARGLDFAIDVAAASHAPVVAIGGLRPEHVFALYAAGLAGFAVIRGVWEASDAGLAVADYLSMHDRARRGRLADDPAEW